MFGKWVAEKGFKNCYVVVSDYVAGHAAGDGFKKAYTAAGGTIVGEMGVPLQGLDFAPYVQRIADQKPAAIFLFLASTKQSEEFAKLYVQTGLQAAGTKLLGATDLFQQSPAAARGTSDSEIGAYTVQNYAWTLDNPLNKKYVADYKKYFGAELHPDFMSASAYSGMEAIYTVIQKLGGTIDGDKAMAVFKTLAFDTPRGPISINPQRATWCSRSISSRSSATRPRASSSTSASRRSRKWTITRIRTGLLRRCAPRNDRETCHCERSEAISYDGIWPMKSRLPISMPSSRRML